MPELQNPSALFAVSLNEHRNSKSLTSPLVQIRNVLPLAGFSGVVWPVIAPSLTDQSRGSPDQPVRSVPLKSFVTLATNLSVVGFSPSAATAERVAPASPKTSRRNSEIGRAH